MARVTAPLLSITAAGPLAGKLSFGRALSGPIVRALPRATARPLRPAATAAQVARRVLYAAGADAWQLLTVPQQQAYTATAYPLGLTGFNLWMREYLSAPTPPAGTQWDLGATTWDAGATVWDVTP